MVQNFFPFINFSLFNADFFKDFLTFNNIFYLLNVKIIFSKRLKLKILTLELM